MTQFLRSYLFAWLFCVGLSLGSLANLMVHQLTGGRWGSALRVPLLSAASLMPVVALSCFPLLIDLPAVFPWIAQPALAATKSWWLNPPFFLARSAFYLAIWSALALRWLSLAAASHGERSPALIRLSAVGLIVYAITLSGAAVDWIMSLTPQWFSSTFGLEVAIAAMQAAMAFAVCTQTWPRLIQRFQSARIPYAHASHAHAPAPDSESKEARRLLGDYGNLLLMYVLSLTYLTYTQFLIVWAEDLPNEISWYLPRVQTSWRNITITLILAQFLVPFVLLLMRPIKRDARYLALIAAALFASQLLLFFYLVKPAFMPAGLALRWSDPAVAVVLVGAWMFAWRRRLLPIERRLA